MQYMIDEQPRTAKGSHEAKPSSQNNGLRRISNLGARLLLALGILFAAGITPADDNMYWDNHFAYPEGNGLDTTVTQVAAGNGNVYVAGNFAWAGQSTICNVAQWNNSGWSALGGGPGYTPRFLGTLGNFVCTATTDHANAWDGTTWTTVYQCPSHVQYGRDEYWWAIENMTGDGQYLYLAEIHWHLWHGPFSESGDAEHTIRRWEGDGSGISLRSRFSLGGGIPGGSIFALTGDASYTYLGGEYLYPGNVCRMVEAVGQNVQGTVNALALIGNTLYAGGTLNHADDVDVSNIAKWDGSSWSALGSGTNEKILAMMSSGNDLYVAGDFTIAGGVSTDHIARWDGSSWSSLGSGLNGKVNSLAMSGRALIAGGEFTTAGGKPSNYLAVWRPRVNVSTGTLSANPGTMTFGNDPCGYYKPALMTGTGTTVSCADTLPTSFTLDQAEVTTVSGQRVNGAFTLSPEGVQFGGDGAILRVEFSEDDANAFGVAYTEFRAVRLARPGSSAPPIALLAPDAPATIRTENGKQIYAITVPLTETGGIFGAVPFSLIPQYGLTLSAVPVEGGTVAIDPPYDEASYACGTAFTLNAQSAPGYMLDHWSGDLTGNKNPATITLTSNMSVCANFVPGYKLTLTTSPPLMGTVSADPAPDSEGKYAPGTVVTLRALPSYLMSFGGWSGALTGFTNPATITMTTDTAVQANFALRYAVFGEAVPASGGSVTVDPPPGPDGMYAAGTVVTVQAIPSPGYSFLRWSGSLSGSDTSVSLTVNRDWTARAHFGPTDAPNLTGSFASVRVTGSARKTLNATFNAINDGTQDAGSYTVQFYLSPDSGLSPASVLVKSLTIRRHQAGHIARLRVSYRPRPGVALSGMRLIAIVDADGIIQEQTEFDNTIVSDPLR